MKAKKSKFTAMITIALWIIIILSGLLYIAFMVDVLGDVVPIQLNANRPMLVLKGILGFVVMMAIDVVGVMLYLFETRKQADRTITQLAYYDTLTGAPNIEKFRMDAQTLINRHGAGKYAMLYIDIRHFRYLNRDLGYTMGDQFLIHVSNTIAQALGAGEVFARISGDMFVLLSKKQGKWADRLRFWDGIKTNIMSWPIITDMSYPVRLICGIYEMNREDVNIQTSIDRANTARKSLKERYDIDIAIYNDEMQALKDREKEIEQTMHAALANGEFTPYLQPKYDLYTGQVVGAEALVRWIKPDGTVTPPDDFIPLFEKTGFISDLDRFMLESVCKHMRAQLDLGQHPVPTSINQSRCYMYNDDYLSMICDTIAKYQIPPELIELEITENIAFKNMDKLVKVIEKLNLNGFQLSLDDFGSGYSSLNVLKDLNVSVLKLDRVFLGETMNSAKGKTVVANIIRMAKELSIHVVAEGVETLEQVEFLQEVHCDLAQGFYFSKPIPMLDFDTLLVKQREPVTI